MYGFFVADEIIAEIHRSVFLIINKADIFKNFIKLKQGDKNGISDSVQKMAPENI